MKRTLTTYSILGSFALLTTLGSTACVAQADGTDEPVGEAAAAIHASPTNKDQCATGTTENADLDFTFGSAFDDYDGSFTRTAQKMNVDCPESRDLSIVEFQVFYNTSYRLGAFVNVAEWQNQNLLECALSTLTVTVKKENIDGTFTAVRGPTTVHPSFDPFAQKCSIINEEWDILDFSGADGLTNHYRVNATATRGDGKLETITITGNTI